MPFGDLDDALRNAVEKRPEDVDRVCAQLTAIIAEMLDGGFGEGTLPNNLDSRWRTRRSISRGEHKSTDREYACRTRAPHKPAIDWVEVQ